MEEVLRRNRIPLRLCLSNKSPEFRKKELRRIDEEGKLEIDKNSRGVAITAPRNPLFTGEGDTNDLLQEVFIKDAV